MQSYDRLIELSRERSMLGSVWEALGWDTRTGMPRGAVAQRAEQEAFLTRLNHRMATDPEIGRLLEMTVANPNASSLSEVQKRNLFLIRRGYDLLTKVPEEFAAELTRQISIAYDAWLKAKAERDWKIFQPHLEKTFQMQVHYSDLLMGYLGLSDPYDVHLDGFERGMTSDYYAKMFKEIQSGIVPMVERYAEASKDVQTDFLKRRVDKSTQLRIVESLAEFLGYDIKSEHAMGKLGETEHPFSTGRYDDVRIALHYYEDDFFMPVLIFLHEAGHALYGMNLNREWNYEPVGQSESNGIHESQSRFMENMVGRSPHFIRYFLPLLNKLVQNKFSDMSTEDFTRALNVVRPSPIRGGSDEVTYSLHLIIRFEIEKAMFANRISVSEIPEIWKEKYDRYLGVTVQDDSMGALQDMHWASGMFGYFPCYALGNVFSAQLAEAMERRIPDWKQQIEAGDSKAVMAWMKQNVHQKGSLYDALDLIKNVTGKEASAKPYLRYLKRKYAGLYGG